MWREKHTAEIFRLALNVPKFFLHQHLIRRNFFIQSDVCCLKILKLEKDKTDHASFSTSFEQQSDGLSLVIVVSIMNLIEQGISTNFTLLYSCRLIKRRWICSPHRTSRNYYLNLLVISRPKKNWPHYSTVNRQHATFLSFEYEIAFSDVQFSNKQTTYTLLNRSHHFARSSCRALTSVYFNIAVLER